MRLLEGGGDGLGQLNLVIAQRHLRVSGLRKRGVRRRDSLAPLSSARSRAFFGNIATRRPAPFKDLWTDRSRPTNRKETMEKLNEERWSVFFVLFKNETRAFRKQSAALNPALARTQLPVPAGTTQYVRVRSRRTRESVERERERVSLCGVSRRIRSRLQRSVLVWSQL